ncbi:AAA family ATPase [Thauera sp. WH-1]|uniref:AAA family ATPase n=1 Tax=Thauera sp. WH-1 TaxID=3398230 RepID=UPI0039FD7A25
METFLTFALGEDKASRFSWDFFDGAHKFAGIRPHVEYEFLPRRGSSKNNNEWLDILGTIQAIAKGNDFPRERPWPDVSKAMADWLLGEFHYEDFNELERLLASKRKRIRLLLGGNGAICETASIAAIRLGILTDMLSLTDAKVRSRLNSSEFSIFDLSSGEYHMYTSILGLGFGMRSSSVVLIDEPENSLHPHWQQEFMDSVFGIGSQALKNGHILVCTHSPLIVSAALDGSTIVDLTDEVPSIEVTSFGASSDEVLFSQFGVGSSRNRVVVDTVQRAVSIVERGGFNNPELETITPELKTIRLALRPGDPLVDVINALLGEDDLR